MKKLFSLFIIISFAFIYTTNAQSIGSNLRKWPIDIRGGYALFIEDFGLKTAVKTLTVNAYLVTDEKKNTFDHRSITAYNFDEKGQLILRRTVKPGSWEDDFPPTHYYYTEITLDSISGGHFNAKFHYNEQSFLQYIQFYTPLYDGTQKTSQKQMYLYDSKGNLIEIKYLDDNNYSYRQLLQYDIYGIYSGYKIIREDTTHFTTKKLEDGSTESTNTSINAKGETTFFSRSIFKTDSLNNVVNIKIYNVNNKLNTQQRIVHQLDKNGNSTSTLTYTNGKLNSKEEKEIKYFDTKNNSTQHSISINDSVKKRDQPDEVVRHFLTALSNRDFKKAYSFCVGKRWGTAEYFASSKSYGAITAVAIKSIGSIDRSVGNTAKIKVLTLVTDSINGSGEFEQLFTMELQANEKWKLSNIKLLASNRPQDNWNLQLTTQNWITFHEAEKFVLKIYDTIPNEPQTESMEDTLQRTLQPLQFFKADNQEYALAIVENRGPYYGVSTGHCDLFLFMKNDKTKWTLSDQLLQAGGGGMYGNPGQFENIFRIGKHSAGIVLSGGQTHMGAYFHNDIIEIKNGKMDNLLNIGTHHSYGNWEGHDGFKVCEDLSYKFLKEEKDMYDLQITVTNCLEGKKTTPKKIVIAYKDGAYSIPEAYIFSN